MVSQSKAKQQQTNAAASAAVLPKTPQQPRKRRTATAAAAAAAASPLAVEDKEQQQDREVDEEVVVETRRHRRRRVIVKEDSAGVTQAEEVVDEEEQTVVKKKKTTTTRRRREPDPLPCTDPTPELLEQLRASNFTPDPRPVPNLGYACLNMELRELKPPVFTNRDCIKRTLDAKGLPYLSELCLANCKDLARVIQWNHEHKIRFFRLSSVLWPWMGTFKATDLPNYEEIKIALRFAGDLARIYDQRISFHPSHFNKLGAATDNSPLVEKTIAELEAHSEILDLMGFLPASPINKINIHVGGIYGDKQETMQRWAANWRRLSDNCRARMTCENDDVASAYSLEDLLYLHELCDRKLPLVFDFHHHRFCPGALTEEQALRAAVATWPPGVRPVVHWSESQPGRKPHAHSDYVEGPLRLYGLEAEIDVMIESKRKERALLALRDGLPIPRGEDVAGGGDSDGEEGGATAVEIDMAMKMLS